METTELHEPGPGRLTGATARLAPGLLLVATGTAVAYAVHLLLPGLNTSTAAVLAGIVTVNSGLRPDAAKPGTSWTASVLLRVGVVLLGLQLSGSLLLQLGARGLGAVVLVVLVTFTGTRLVGHALGLSPARSLLIATGFSICGASAVAAMEPVADAEPEDTAVAVALVTLCGSLAILLLPWLAGPLGLDAGTAGRWIGASVQDVGQTVATASRLGPTALHAAVVVKLSRVVLLAPLVAGVALRRRHVSGAPVRDEPAVPPVLPLPLFVVGFLAAVGLRSTGILPAWLLTGASTAQQLALTAALFALGTGIHVPTLARTGRRPVLLGLASWLLVAGSAYAAVRCIG